MDIKSSDYRYKAFTKQGWEVGYISAGSKIEALTIARRLFDRIISINRCWMRFKASSAAVIDWFNALALLMKEGVKIEDALEFISSEKEYAFSLGMIDLIKSGYSFAESMSFYQFFFDAESITIMKSLSSILSIQQICDFIIEYKKRSQDKYDAMKKSLIQPCFVILFIIIICLCVTFFLKDSIESVFLDMKIPLPWLLAFINSLTPAKLLLGASGFILSTVLIRSKLYEIHVVAKYFILNDISMTFYFIGMSLKNGVSIMDAISISSQAAKTKFVKRVLIGLKDSIIQGNSVFNSLKDLDGVYRKIIRVSEVSGNLSQGFLSVSEIAGKDLSKRLTFLEKSISPCITVFAGIIILFFLKTFIFPMYESISSTIM